MKTKRGKAMGEKQGGNAVFRTAGEDGYVEMLPGIRRRTLGWGRETLIAEFRLGAGSRIPEHAHPQEQTGRMITGRMTFYVEGAAREVGPGDAWVLPGGVTHAVDVHEDSVVVEVFSPVREDYK